jgi:hypothetical protein
MGGAGRTGSVATDLGDHELCRIAAADPGRSHHGLADTQGEPAATRRHDAGSEVDRTDRPAHPELLESPRASITGAGTSTTASPLDRSGFQ